MDFVYQHVEKGKLRTYKLCCSKHNLYVKRHNDSVTSLTHRIALQTWLLFMTQKWDQHAHWSAESIPRGVWRWQSSTRKLTVGAPRCRFITVWENDLKSKTVFVGFAPIHVVETLQRLNITVLSLAELSSSDWPAAVTPYLSRTDLTSSCSRRRKSSSEEIKTKPARLREFTLLVSFWYICYYTYYYTIYYCEPLNDLFQWAYILQQRICFKHV